MGSTRDHLGVIARALGPGVCLHEHAQLHVQERRGVGRPPVFVRLVCARRGKDNLGRQEKARRSA